MPWVVLEPRTRNSDFVALTAPKHVSSLHVVPIFSGRLKAKDFLVTVNATDSTMKIIRIPLDSANLTD